MKIFAIALALIIALPFKIFAAQVLQVYGSNSLLIGDNNRSYKVKIACIDIDPESEEEAVNWLKNKLPRRTKVNIKPKAFSEGVILARLIDVKSSNDIAESMHLEGLGKLNCSN